MTSRKPPATADKPIHTFRSKSAWSAWLARHHTKSPGIWLRLAKKGTGGRSVSHQDAIDVALCYGWIDGQARRDGDEYWMLSFSPRRPRSLWSARNREKALALIARQEMRPAGLAEVDRARQDGRWDAAYEGPAKMAVPPDLRQALGAVPAAACAFEALDSRNRYGILFRIETARRAETRARRIDQFVRLLASGGRLYPVRPSGRRSTKEDTRAKNKI